MAATTSSTLKTVLIVLAVIFALLALFYFMAIVPQRARLQMTYNEVSAIQSIRSISQAEIMYADKYPGKGFACSLGELSNSPESPIELTLGQGKKAGYVFNITNCAREIVHHQDWYTSFEITAVPESPGKTGGRGFCADEDNTIKYDPEGGTNCTKPVE